jgi:hypothetical protein
MKKGPPALSSVFLGPFSFQGLILSFKLVDNKVLFKRKKPQDGKKQGKSNFGYLRMHRVP